MQTDSRTLLMSSKMIPPHEKSSSDSRIIEKKQIQKRLEGLSMNQYDRISKNLLKQNLKLKQDVNTLGDKVKKLIQSKKYDTQHKRNPLIESEILNEKKQLQKQYTIMNGLKDEINQSKQFHLTEQLKTSMKDKKNELKVIQRQLQLLTNQKQKLIDDFKDNQCDYQQYMPTKDHVAQFQLMKKQNKQLKKKVYQTTLSIKDGQKVSKQAITKIYDLKKSGQSLGKRSRIKSLSVLSKPQQYTTQEDHVVQAVRTLQQDVKALKKKKVDIQTQLSTDQAIKQSARSKMQKQIRQLLEYHKQLFKRRVRQLTQLNYYQRKQADMKQKMQAEQQRIILPLLQRGMQTQTILKKSYRKQWIGQNIGIIFNDSDILLTQQPYFIRSLTVFRTVDHIVFIRFGYQSQNSKRRIQSKAPFDKEILKKMEGKRLISKDNGYLVAISVSITKNIITRIQTKWSDGDSLVQGWENEESNKYKFDIGQKERPISFYGTVVTHPKGSYALQSLGCQILQNQQ